MNKCPITYEHCEGLYSIKGLKQLSPNLKDFEALPYDTLELRQEAARRAVKMSIQGIQPKLSARLNTSKQKMEIVDIKGTYILKPNTIEYRELPQNEDLTMKLASSTGIETPLHGMLYNKDNQLTYFIKRFDRKGKNKIAIEDFAQLAGLNRDNKYSYSMEKVVDLINNYCTFPVLEKIKLFRRIIFNFLIGNEDMHLKNYSLISRNQKVELSPAYDLLNTTIALNTEEEIALTIKGKKKNLTSKLLIDYYAKNRLNLNSKIITKELDSIEHASTKWSELIEKSFLSEDLKQKYLQLVKKRKAIIY